MARYPIYVFDAYGTLFDVHSAAAKHAGEIGPAWERLSQVWRTKHLEYTWIWAGTGRHTSFWKLAGDSLDAAAATVFGGRSGAGPDAVLSGRSGAGPDAAGLPAGLRERLLASYRTLDAFPEVPRVLAKLKSAGARLAILTNGDPDMIADAVKSAGLEGAFDRLITVHEAGVFKPHRAVYDLVTGHFGVPLDQVSFQSSNRWDVTAGKVAGMRAVWINRSDAPEEYPDTPPDLIVSDLTPLVQEA